MTKSPFTASRRLRRIRTDQRRSIGAPRLLLAGLGIVFACGGEPLRPATIPAAPAGTAVPRTAGSAPAGADPSAKEALEKRLLSFAQTRGHRLGMPTSVRWTHDGTKLLFLRAKSSSDPTQVLFEYDVATGAVRELITPETLLSGASESVSPEERARRERLRIQAKGIVSYELSADDRLVLVPLAGRIFVFERASASVREVAVPEGTFDPRLSPDGTRVAYVRNNNLYSASIVPTGKSAELALTKGGSSDVTLGMAEFVAQEELERTRGFWFSPDGTQVLYEEADLRGVERLVVSDLARPEREPMSSRYPRAGKPNAKTRFGIVPAKGGSTRWLKLPAGYEYVAQVSWEKGHPPMFTLLDRAQRKLAIWTEGAADPIATRDDPSWIDVDDSSPKWAPNGALLWNADVEQLGTRSQSLGAQALHPSTVRYQKLLGTNADGTRVFFMGGDRPTASRVYYASNGAVVPVTAATENVSDAVLSHDGMQLAAYTTSLGAWPEWRVVSVAGGSPRALPNVVTWPAALPKVELVTLGESRVNAAIVRPTTPRVSFARKLPVIDAAYGGPHVNLVVESALAYVRAQWVADATGAIVVTIDGRGTPRRGKAWERAISGHLGEVPLTDHASAMRALGDLVKDADTTRVGIYGWSFGGYLSALAAVRRPDVFKAAVVGAPVIDFRDYDSCYTERYLGMPDTSAAAYDEASVLFELKKRPKSAPILLFHGTSDDNVYFAHSLKLEDALLRAGRDFRFVPLSAMTHGVSDPELTVKLWTETAAFFRERLR